VSEVGHTIPSSSRYKEVRHADPNQTDEQHRPETLGRAADALGGLAAVLTDLFGLRRPSDARRWESFDEMAWGLSDIAETLTRLERVFNETPRYRRLGPSARKAARAVEELEEAWTQVFLETSRETEGDRARLTNDSRRRLPSSGEGPSRRASVRPQRGDQPRRPRASLVSPAI